MLLKITLLVVFLLSLISAEILFVNEVCRHGARAPEVEEYDFAHFPNGKGMLTASGFRQHYLIGHQLRKRYVKENESDHKLLDQHYNPDEIYVRSTQVERTIQSAEAQLLGLYPLESTKKAIGNFMKDEVTIDDYQPIPVHNFGLYVDDMTAYGFCPFMVNDYLNRTKNPEVWQEYDDYFRPLIYDQIATAFGITPEDINFQDIYPLSDILWAEDFQGVQNRYKFTNKEWEIVKQIQLPSLVELLSDTSNKIMVSRFLNPVVEMMKSKIGLSFNETLVSDFKNAKYLFFSNHDYQLSHILKFLSPENLDYKYIEYASILLIEFHRFDRAACEHSKAKNCYYVKVFYNNDQLKLPGCTDLDCYFDQFERYIQKQGYTYEEMYKICYSEAPLQVSKAELNKFNSYIYS